MGEAMSGKAERVQQRCTATYEPEQNYGEPHGASHQRRKPNATLLPISGGQGVVGSNPAVPTQFKGHIGLMDVPFDGWVTS
ncbi:hypothetical protein [Salinispora vitiensis]|uniref:hypothetical protein n=1 Tax=Salinispora vitiensis TaxID=999544 RepID=UPI0013A54629|nr:hypothetical protein [Salinispora vitiensis]